ncbi:MAG TPA: histidine phosphatase family protein [Caulobacteraceae bacterium]|nr:histidine phosphatase family protein [Caulobacteraceae bacterium]
MATGAKQAGTIVLARHGEPALSRKTRLSAAGYADWWAVYEETGLVPGQIAPEALIAHAEAAGVIVSSTRPRSIETARLLAGERNFQSDPDLIEAPLPPPHWPRWIKLSPRIWGVVSRFWWWFLNHHDGHETRRQAQVRADAVAERLAADAERGMNVLVIAHGFFNTMVRLSLQRRGWRLVQTNGYRYWSFAQLVRE